jgi:hypothetical protein
MRRAGAVFLRLLSIVVLLSCLWVAIFTIQTKEVPTQCEDPPSRCVMDTAGAWDNQIEQRLSVIFLGIASSIFVGASARHVRANAG